MAATKGQCLLSVIPVRADAKSQSEIVTQLLYGETYQILDTRHDWINIAMDNDGYQGWISANQFSNKKFEPEGLVSKALYLKHQSSIIPFGGHIPEQQLGSNLSLLESAKLFLGCPYMWGGRTFMGIDCSGFIQVIHKAQGIALPRDASQQVFEGTEVAYADRKATDLVFFVNELGKVHHVGMLVSEDEIIHASGSVRIDTLTRDGIIQNPIGKCTHTYHQIRRLI